MKSRFSLFAFAWLATLGGLMAQPPRPGEPASEASLYGAGPATQAQMFQKPPALKVPQVGANATTGNSTTGGLPSTNPGGDLAPIGGLQPQSGAGNATTPNANGTAGTGAGATPIAAVPSAVPSGMDVSALPMPATPANIDNEHYLVPGDLIALKIVEDREDRPSLLLVAEDGTINVPWTNEPMKVEGSTLHDTAQQIQDHLSSTTLGFYKTGHPIVLAAYYRSEGSRGKVYIDGSVQKPGYINIPPNKILTVWDVIHDYAGGFRGDADSEHVIIHHPVSKSNAPTASTPAPGTAPAKPEAVDALGDNSTVLNVAEMMKNGHPPDMPVKPGDFISVPSKTDTTGSVTVLGKGVGRPSVLPITPQNHTVFQALSQVGYDKFSDLKSTHLLRNVTDAKTGKVEKTDTVLNMSEFIYDGKGTAGEKELQNGDVILVDQRHLISPFD